MTDITVEGLLEHYGVKGMRWGQRKSEGTSALSEDAAKASAAKAKAKQEGTQALSNKEMRDLVTRMQLESQLKNVTPKSRKRKGAEFVATMLVNTGKQQAQLALNDAVGKQVKKAMGG